MKKKLPYADVEILVYAYQEGSKDAIETLLAHYEGYFLKFLEVLKYKYPVYRDGQRMMRYSKFDIYNTIQRRFATAFMKTKYDRDSVKFYRKNPAIKVKVYKAVGHIRHMFQNHDSDDLLQSMRLIFIEMAASHKGTKFYNYVSTTFPKKLLCYLLKTLNRVKEEPFFDDDEWIWKNKYYRYDDYALDREPVKYRINAMEQTLYDVNWINGDCEEPFDHLTPYERRILKWYYEEKTFFPEDFTDRAMYEEHRQKYKCNDTEIAERLGCSRKTVNQKRNQVVESVAEVAIEKRLLRE